MRLPSLFCRFAGLLFAVAVATASDPAVSEPAKSRVLLIGVDARAGLDGAALPSDSRVSLNALPGKGGVDAALFGARLKASTVSTLPDTRPKTPGAFEELFLAARVGLGAGEAGHQLALGGDVLTIPAFGDRFGVTLDAFDARFRRVAFVEVIDPDDVFPAAMPELTRALEPLGFDMLVLMIAPAEASECLSLQPLHASLASGLADRPPFGDGNGATTRDEAESYLGDALRRATTRGCGPGYSLILNAVDDPGHVVVAHPLVPVSEIADRLDRETFAAMLLDGSDNAAALADYLESCTYCPGEARLSSRYETLAGRARISALEDEMWAEIKDDPSRERLAIYVDHCQLCIHSDEALTRIERLEEAEALARRERQDFTAARDGRDLVGLRAYLETCETCTNGDEARALVAEFEADAAYRAERALLSKALEMQNPAALDDYLATCAVCDGADEARELQDRLAALETLRAPCLEAAGLPQMGGPRKFEDIDQARAGALCGKAAEAFPDDALVRVLLGRIAQAAGDDATAAEAYSFGMTHGVPAAFGLAAFAEYAPTDGSAIDPREVEAIALKGAEKGDWLSHEVLTVLYSKDLVPGKSGPEAFDAALRIAREGNPLAQFFVGYYYLTGVGQEISEPKAVEWFEAAVDGGYTQANGYLAEIYERSTTGLARPDLAAELFWTGLQQGDATATDQLTTDLASRSAEVVRIIQGKLREQGLYQGAVDGVPGPGTEAAIRAFASALGGQG